LNAWGYIAENLHAIHESLDLNYQDIYKLVKNAFQASFIFRKEKKAFIRNLEEFISGYAKIAPHSWLNTALFKLDSQKHDFA
jgi:adenosine deaminase